jgi:hypothetical protein
MGAAFLPYQTGQGTGHTKEMILDNLRETLNVYHWSMMRSNLPGSEIYDLSMAWVVKVRPD